MSEYLNRQIEARQQAWHAAKALLDGAAAESRDLTSEEEQSYGRMMADIDERGQKIKDLQAAEARSAEIEAAVAEAPEVRAVREVKPEKAASDIRALLNGEVRSINFERRALNTSDDSSLVPTDFLAEVQKIMTTVGDDRRWRGSRHQHCRRQRPAGAGSGDPPGSHRHRGGHRDFGA